MGKTPAIRSEYTELIVALRDNHGLSYQKIADEIYRRTGARRTRQGIQQAYEAAKKAERKLANTKELAIDAIYLKELGYTQKESSEMLGVSQYKLNEAVERTTRADRTIHEAVHGTLVNRVVDVVDQGQDMQAVVNAMCYKEFAPKEAEVYRVLVEVCQMIVGATIDRQCRSLAIQLGNAKLGRTTAKAFGRSGNGITGGLKSE